GGTDPIGDIAFALGFDEQGSFARFFKRETGMTPTEYRNR
ncbi:MAG: AraC family transcriptional regulator, partial [Bacteroidales bacterium]|nr:AraC family transcriptional regulator [Bacteroidales bacterium]